MPTSETDSGSFRPAPPAADAIPSHQHDPIAEQPPMLSNLAYANAVNNINLAQQNAVANQQALNELGITVVGKTVRFLTDASSQEPVAQQGLETDMHRLPSAAPGAAIPGAAKS